MKKRAKKLPSKVKKKSGKPRMQLHKLPSDFKGAFILFVILALFFAVFTQLNKTSNAPEPAQETTKGISTAKKVEDKVFSSQGIMQDGELSYARLSAMTGMAYDVLRSDLGVEEQDVVIFVEDESGNPIPIGENGEICIGDPSAKVRGVPCSK